MMLKKTIKKTLRLLQTPFILKDYFSFRKKIIDKRFELNLKNAYPQIKDKTIKTGFDRHYIYHTAWAARKVKEINPEFHTDISSSLYFSGIVSAFVPIKFYDYRPADLVLSNLETKSADLTNLDFADNSIKSLSCMHVVEHIGLGRYGDDLDPDGDLKAMKELQRVLASDGSLLFVVPMGNKAKIEFNAHRIYTFAQIKDYFRDLELREFSFVRENSGAIIVNANDKDLESESYGAGCFHFVKK
ncbi:MAG: DUF268 domain-containing protein [Patescibacteria group bacterium]|nr:DUF268 domain-containing protein [Patescibacteria group bacterium]